MVKFGSSSYFSQFGSLEYPLFGIYTLNQLLKMMVKLDPCIFSGHFSSVCVYIYIYIYLYIYNFAFLV
jgi:hypothetical protein